MKFFLLIFTFITIPLFSDDVIDIKEEILNIDYMIKTKSLALTKLSFNEDKYSSSEGMITYNLWGNIKSEPIKVRKITIRRMLDSGKDEYSFYYSDTENIIYIIMSSIYENTGIEVSTKIFYKDEEIVYVMNNDENMDMKELPNSLLRVNENLLKESQELTKMYKSIMNTFSNSF